MWKHKHGRTYMFREIWASGVHTVPIQTRQIKAVGWWHSGNTFSLAKHFFSKIKPPAKNNTNPAHGARSMHCRVSELFFFFKALAKSIPDNILRFHGVVGIAFLFCYFQGGCSPMGTEGNKTNNGLSWAKRTGAQWPLAYRHCYETGIYSYRSGNTKQCYSASRRWITEDPVSTKSKASFLEDYQLQPESWVIGPYQVLTAD